MSSFLTNEYGYSLPTARIANVPCRPRDASRLLCLCEEKISHKSFRSLPNLLPSGSVLFLNESSVLPVRLKMKKSTGTEVEVFLLESKEAHFCDLLEAHSPLYCKALLRPSSRISLGSYLETKSNSHQLQIIRKTKEEVELRWQPEVLSFLEILSHFGQVPLPPYIRRPPRRSDTQHYQCVYSSTAGSVAAPTAGLHFTPRLLRALSSAGHTLQYLQLHVGASTFLPIQEKDVRNHNMHNEYFSVPSSVLTTLQKGKSIAVGTTSVRTIESIYWYGCLLAKDKEALFNIPQYVYKKVKPIPPSEALARVEDHIRHLRLKRLEGKTSLYITPGYFPKLTKGLITNFHQPYSTLLVLVAALIGKRWQKVYEEALRNEYRFLSYGDACLFLL